MSSSASQQHLDKHQKWLDTSHLAADLKGRSIRGGISTVGVQAVAFVLNLATTVLLARLLTPEDYGLVAMVTAITGFVLMFRDLGLSSAVVQRQEITQEQTSGLFWINTLISLGIALIMALLAPAIAVFYGEPRLTNITLVFAAALFISGISLQHQALMKRQMMFRNLSLIQIVSTALNLITGIVLALLGFGYWAVVATSVLVPVYSTVALWIVCDWRPALVFRANDLGSLLRFGVNLTGFEIVNYFSRNTDKVLIGKFMTSSILGIYTKAYQLLLLPITQLRDPLNSVALPALSSLQNDPAKYNTYYSRYLFTLAFFTMPLVTYAAIFADELILFAMGPQWVDAAPIFKLLAISAFVQPVASTQGLVMITTGQARRYFIVGTVNAIIVVMGFAIGIYWGVVGVTIAYAIVTYTVLGPSLMYSLKGSPVTPRKFLGEISYPALFSIIAGMVAIAYKEYVPAYSLLLTISVGLLITAAIYFLLWFAGRQPRERLNKITEIVFFVFRRP